MLPPVLEIYAVWHPGDAGAKTVSTQIFEHFHGTTFSGLIGGAVEVYERSSGWCSSEDAPRQIPFPGHVDTAGVPTSHVVAVVPIVGNELAATIEAKDGPWKSFIEDIANARGRDPNHIGVFPFALDDGAFSGTCVGTTLSRFQRIGAPRPGPGGEPLEELLCRDLSQGIAQLLRPGSQRLKVFISHTKRAGEGEVNTAPLVALVRKIISETRLQQFFDANDLQPGEDWDEALRANAASSALLVLRTDLYSSREWCQREVSIAKRSGMPVVTLDCLSHGEERGSFLLDHVPRIPLRSATPPSTEDVRRALNLLVDECLKRELWTLQEQLASGNKNLDVSWWAPHAPEPITLLNWLNAKKVPGATRPGSGIIRVLHPDPPLGPEEVTALRLLVKLVEDSTTLEVMTPRMLAARGA